MPSSPRIGRPFIFSGNRSEGAPESVIAGILIGRLKDYSSAERQELHETIKAIVAEEFNLIEDIKLVRSATPLPWLCSMIRPAIIRSED